MDITPLSFAVDQAPRRQSPRIYASAIEAPPCGVGYVLVLLTDLSVGVTPRAHRPQATRRVSPVCHLLYSLALSCCSLTTHREHGSAPLLRKNSVLRHKEFLYEAGVSHRNAAGEYSWINRKW